MTQTSPALSVSRFEAVLIRQLRSMMRTPGEPSPAYSPPAGRLNVPSGLSPACLHLVRDTLSKGCVLYLAKVGGWRREKHLHSGQPRSGRLWERVQRSDLALSFSKHTISFLMWLAAGRPDKTQSWDAPENELTTADHFLFFLAYESVRETEAQTSLRGRAIFQKNGLIRLFFPEDFGNAGGLPIDFATWTADVGASIVESLQTRLQHRWLEIERGKNQIGDWPKLRQIGQSQDVALSSFLDACKTAERPDLARFLLRAMADLLSPDLTPQFWIGGLQGTGPPRLAERLETQRNGLAVLKQLEKLGQWTRTARGTGYLDENYAVAQLWLSDWEQYRGDDLLAIAQGLLRQLEPLKVTGAGPSAAPTITPAATEPR
jgi:hypothetical protein